MNKTDLLVYIGGATERKVTEAEWEAAGVKGQKTVVWDRKNRHRVAVGELTTPAIELLMDAHENEFRVVKAAEAKELPDTVVDPNSGAAVPPPPNGE